MEKLPPGLNPEQKVMAEEVLHRDPSAIILPPGTEGGKLPGTESMVPVYHIGPLGCQKVAFYYTHMLDRAGGEMPTATRAKFPDGSRPDRGQPMMCGSCKAHVNIMCDLRWGKLT